MPGPCLRYTSPSSTRLFCKITRVYHPRGGEECKAKLIISACARGVGGSCKLWQSLAVSPSLHMAADFFGRAGPAITGIMASNIH